MNEKIIQLPNHSVNGNGPNEIGEHNFKEVFDKLLIDVEQCREAHQLLLKGFQEIQKVLQEHEKEIDLLKDR